MTNSQAPQPAHTPGPWAWVDESQDGNMPALVSTTGVEVCNFGDSTRYYPSQGSAPNEHDKRLIAAAPELLAACINARDMLATDRQAFVDCQQLRDSRTNDPIAHGLVAVEDGVWLDADDAEALRDYDRAIELIDKATAKATGAQA